MLDLRKRIFIIISLAIGFILAFTLLFYFLSNKKKAEEVAVSLIGETAQESAEQSSGGSSVPTGGAVTKPIKEPVVFTPVEKSRSIYAKQIAKLFVERFTTFSNQNDGANIDDALALTTASMGKWVETQKIKEASDYQGVTTNVIAVSLQTIDDNRASVKVDTMQIKSDGGVDTTSYRSGTVDLVDVSGEWKVDGFYWDTN